jgi:hypothetical protein
MGERGEDGYVQKDERWKEVLKIQTKESIELGGSVAEGHLGHEAVDNAKRVQVDSHVRIWVECMWSARNDCEGRRG